MVSKTGGALDSYDHVYNILRLFNAGPNFHFTTSATKCVASQVTERLKT